MMARSPLVTPPDLAAANDGTKASSAVAPATSPAPVAAARPRNCLRSVPGSACSTDILLSPFWRLRSATASTSARPHRISGGAEWLLGDQGVHSGYGQRKKPALFLAARPGGPLVELELEHELAGVGAGEQLRQGLRE